jgi:hypothetical protein
MRLQCVLANELIPSRYGNAVGLLGADSKSRRCLLIRCSQAINPIDELH